MILREFSSVRAGLEEGVADGWEAHRDASGPVQ